MIAGKDQGIPNLKFQQGEVPSARYRHTLTEVNNTRFLLVGGVELLNRDNLNFRSHGMFQPSTRDRNLYKMSMEDGSKIFWKKPLLPAKITQRAFHSATFCTF